MPNSTVSVVEARILGGEGEFEAADGREADIVAAIRRTVLNIERMVPN